MQATTEIKEAIEKTFDYLLATTTFGDRKRLRKKLVETAPGSVIQVIDHRTFKCINDLEKVYVCDASCSAFYTDAQFRSAWTVTTGKRTTRIRLKLDGELLILPR